MNPPASLPDVQLLILKELEKFLTLLSHYAYIQSLNTWQNFNQSGIIFTAFVQSEDRLVLIIVYT